LPVSVIGIGIMGTAIATRLLACGHAVTLCGRTPAKLAPLETLGATCAASPADNTRARAVMSSSRADLAALMRQFTGLTEAHSLKE
jgi:3-hydroxyisobutyrate dehydrogenase-like beta-hydroxyacid dehydrogenase